jgi:hypothetical protein
MPYTPDDPDLLPGTADVAAPDASKEAGTGYLWDAAFRKGLRLGIMGSLGILHGISCLLMISLHPVVRNPFEEGIVQFYPAKVSLQEVSDSYFRGYDQKNADFWLFKEWEREFDAYVQYGNLPNLQLVRFPMITSAISPAIDGVDTPDKQMADNDYAMGSWSRRCLRARTKTAP